MARRNKERLTTRDLQAIERRQQILDTAKSLFAQNGYHATTTRAISREIKMADGLIYHYFPQGKQEILWTIVDEYSSTNLLEIKKRLAAIPDSLPIRETLLEIGSLFLHNLMHDRDVITIVLREQQNLSQDLFWKVGEEIKLIGVQITQILEKRAARNEIAVFDFNLMANQFFSPISLYLLQLFLFNGNNLFGLTADAYLEAVIDHTLKTWQSQD